MAPLEEASLLRGIREEGLAGDQRLGEPERAAARSAIVPGSAGCGTEATQMTRRDRRPRPVNATSGRRVDVKNLSCTDIVN
jgi:hypothetical protein